MPAVATVLPARSEGSVDAGLGKRDQRGERLGRRARATATTWQALVAGEHHLGLVGDRQVGPPGGDLLDRRRRVGGHAAGRPRARPPRSSRGLERRVDPGVVGVDVEVERQVELLRLAAAAGSSLLAAAGERRCAATSESAASSERRARIDAPFRPSTRRAARSSSAEQARRARSRSPRARRPRRTARRRLRAGRCRPGSGARGPRSAPDPLAEDRADHAPPRRRSWRR